MYLPKITWVPSKKAIEAGLVPADYTVYDIDVASFEGKAQDLVMQSVEGAAVIKYRHGLNNECATAWLNASGQGEKVPENAIENTPENRAKFLHEYRTEYRDNFIAGKLGVRTSKVVIPKTALELETEWQAALAVKAHARSQGADIAIDFPLSQKMLDMEVGRQTLAAWITDLLASKRGPGIRELAEKKAAERAAEAANAAATAVEGDDDPFANMGLDEAAE